MSTYLLVEDPRVSSLTCLCFHSLSPGRGPKPLVLLVPSTTSLSPVVVRWGKSTQWGPTSVRSVWYSCDPDVDCVQGRCTTILRTLSLYLWFVNVFNYILTFTLRLVFQQTFLSPVPSRRTLSLQVRVFIGPSSPSLLTKPVSET